MATTTLSPNRLPSTGYGRLAHLFVLPLGFFLLGCILAIHFVTVGWQPTETTRAAASLARHFTLADPFPIPTGPTAHVSPVQAAFMAAIYVAFGIDTRAANIALGIWNAALFSIGIAAMLACLARFGGAGSRRPGPPAAAACLLLPLCVILYYDVTTYRVWEQPLSAVILICGWLVLLRFEAAPSLALLATMAALAGGSFLLTAAIMPSLMLALLWMLWLDRARSGILRRAVIAALIVAAIVLPWGIRNRIELGRFIVTRSNAGLELALGNQPTAQGASSRGWTLPLHPSLSRQAAETMRAEGEIRYNDEMGQLARGWIAADPARFVRLTLTRIRLTFFPEPTWFPLLGTRGGTALLWALGGAKIVALVMSLLLRIRPAQCLVFCVLPLAPYWVTHVYLRYTLLTTFTTIGMIGLVAASAMSWRRSAAGRGVNLREEMG